MKDLKSKLKDIPKKPGVYEFINKDNQVVYVGKAKNLKTRVSQYFQKHDNRPQLPYLLAEATDIKYVVVNNELESAFLENTLIKQYNPKYNIDLKDDKNYAFITIDYSTQIPKISYARKIEPEKTKASGQKVVYFGPYSAVHKIRQTLSLVRKIFPYCAAEKVGSRPCFYYYMHRCPGVCIGKISLAEYEIYLQKINKFLKGDISNIVQEIKKEMLSAAKQKRFEVAARLRDQLKSLEILLERQSVILNKKVDWDLVSIAQDAGYFCINLFKVRQGKLYDKENFVYDAKPEDLVEDLQNLKILVQQKFLERYYMETSSFPKMVYSEYLPENTKILQGIALNRTKKNLKFLTAKKGKQADLLKMGHNNAQEYLKKWLEDRAGNLDKINQSLAQLKQVLNLPTIPKRIECYDNSNIQGTNPVGSMVVFMDGLPAKSQYRKFKFNDNKKPDDFAMMKEMLTRRLARSVTASSSDLKIDKAVNEPSSENKTWPVPDLIVIDGGKGQLAAAVSAMQQVGLKLPIIGLAKRIEEIFLPGESQPILLEHNEPGLQMLQRLRDEAHRFGITFHRQLRSKQAVKSALDEIPGVGPKIKKILKQKIGSVADIKKVDLKDLQKIVGQTLAEKIKKYL